MHSALFKGHLLHRRYKGVDNSFRYPLFQFSFDLEELPRLSEELRLFSYNRRNLHSLFDSDYRASGSLHGHILEQTEQAEIKAPIARIELMTHVRMLGYVFNPVSFFLCYSADQSLVCVVAQVNNTWGQTHHYLLDESNRTHSPGDATAVFTARKQMVVSPLIHDPCSYEFRFHLTPEKRGITMHLARDSGERFFTATLSGTRAPLTDASLAWVAVRYPLMTGQVIALIHWQAMRLRLSGVPYRAPRIP